MNQPESTPMPFKFLLLLVLLLAAQPAHAEGAFREKLKERIKERMQEKSGSTTAGSTDSAWAHINEPGDYRFSFEHGGLTRLYLVHVPRSYDAKKPTPLLFAFHGGGGDMDYMAKDEFYGLTSKSEKEGFVIVYPNGYSKFKSGKFATWNAGTCCGDARDKNVDDVGFVKKIIEKLQRQLNIDSTKIFATGMSNGGMMSHRLACDMAGTFKAIAAVAGTDGTLNCAPVKPISTMHIHAQNDDHVLFNGGAGQGAFKDISKVTNFTSVPMTISKWAMRNGCSSKPERVLSVPGAYCDLYSSCKDNVEVKLCVTESGAHSWPGGKKPRGDEPPSTAISANDQMWDFFMSLP